MIPLWIPLSLILPLPTATVLSLTLRELSNNNWPVCSKFSDPSSSRVRASVNRVTEGACVAATDRHSSFSWTSTFRSRHAIWAENRSGLWGLSSPSFVNSWKGGRIVRILEKLKKSFYAGTLRASFRSEPRSDWSEQSSETFWQIITFCLLSLFTILTTSNLPEFSSPFSTNLAVTRTFLSLSLAARLSITPN